MWEKLILQLQNTLLKFENRLRLPPGNNNSDEESGNS
jgi:hypothetical protein